MRKTIRIVILLSLLTTFFACSPNLIEENADDMIELTNWFFSSGVPNNQIKVKHESEQVTFECAVDEGKLWLLGPSYEKKVIAKPNDVFRFYADGEIDIAYIDIVVKTEDRIIGYAVIKITQKNDSNEYAASLLKSIIYPKLDNEYQIVTDDEVKKAINQAKKGR